MVSSSATLLATLGGKPQVVTFALDALRAQGIRVAEVRLFHLAPTEPTHRLRRALTVAHHALHEAGVRSIRPIPFGSPDGVALTDVNDSAATHAVWQTLHREIGSLTKEAHPLHLCVTGGPRLLALLALSVAALHFRAQDRVWHLFTPVALREAAGEGAILHAPPDGPLPHLIEVPIMPGSEVFPALRSLLAADPRAVQAVRRSALSDADRTACSAVWAALTPRPREVLALVAQGYVPAEVATRLVIAESTVTSHLNAIYKGCRQAWGMDEGAALDYRWLRERFGQWEGMG